MKICPNCGEKTDSKFCPECGKDLTDVEIYKCSKCGSEIEEVALFCPECGAKIDTEIAQDQSMPSQDKDDADSSDIELVDISLEDNNVSLNDVNEVNDSVLHPESVVAVESVDNTEVSNDTPSSSISSEANDAQSSKKPKKKPIGIIVGIVAVVAILAIMGLGKPSGPKVDHYSINYYTPYDGDSTSSIEGMDLIAVYDNEEEVTIDKSEWYISDPAVLTAPTTDITIRYNNEDLYFTINVNEATPEPEPEPAKLEDMTVRDMMDSIESYLDDLIIQDKCEKYQESDNGKYIFINWPSGSKALVSGIVFNKYVNDEYVEVDSTDEKPDSMNVRTQETMIQGETGWFVKGQSTYAMEYMMKAILPSEFGDDDTLYDKLSEMQNEAGEQMTGDGSYAISEKEIGGYKVTLLLTQSDDKLDSVFSIKF